MSKILEKELSHTIVGVAIDVLNELKCGLDEKLYEKALAIGLRRVGHTVDVQRAFPVFYHGELIGNLVPDLIVDNAVIVDSKVVSAFNEAHISQMIGYLAITGFQLAILLNFKAAKLEYKRVVRQNSVTTHVPDLHAKFA